jgi:FMN reductase
MTPYIVGIGGTTRPGSSTEKAVSTALRHATALGARTRLLGAEAIDLPMYAPERAERSPAAERLVAEVRRADGLIIGSPGYHGGVSGLLKNALDYVEDLARDEYPYLQNRPVGLIATGAGWQGAVVTLAALRGIVHALRGWPTPLGVPINTLEPCFDAAGVCLSTKLDGQLQVMAGEMMNFVRARNLFSAADDEEAA